MGRLKIKPKEPKFIVYVVAVTSVKIYSTDDPEVAKERATEVVREALKTQDNNVMIPRCMVQPYGMKADEIQEQLGIHVEE